MTLRTLGARGGEKVKDSQAYSPREFTNLFSLIGDNSTKKLLLDLVSSHSSTTLDNDDDDEEKLEVNDIIPGKGKGLVILLYGIDVPSPVLRSEIAHIISNTRILIGPPGVGKTSTAETIAIATRKPLFSVSVADVGTKAKHVESNLSRIFSLATKWQAILLMLVFPAQHLIYG